MKWILVGIIVAATVANDLLQSIGMRHHGEIHDFRPGAIGRVLAVLASNRFIIAAVLCSAVSFFTFLQGFAKGLPSLFAFRFGLGLAEAPCFPANNRMVRAGQIRMSGR